MIKFSSLAMLSPYILVCHRCSMHNKNHTKWLACSRWDNKVLRGTIWYAQNCSLPAEMAWHHNNIVVVYFHHDVLLESVFPPIFAYFFFLVAINRATIMAIKDSNLDHSVECAIRCHLLCCTNVACHTIAIDTALSLFYYHRQIYFYFRKIFRISAKLNFVQRNVVLEATAACCQPIRN